MRAPELDTLNFLYNFFLCVSTVDTDINNLSPMSFEDFPSKNNFNISFSLFVINDISSSNNELLKLYSFFDKE